MLRQALIACVLTAVAGTVLAASRIELESRLLDHLNEQMYGSCRAVVLTDKSGDVYEGYVRFHNGRRSDLRVTVSAEGIEYTLGAPASTGPKGELPARERLRQAKTRLQELQILIGRQEREIARLEELCRPMEDDIETAAVDPNAEPPAPTEHDDGEEVVTREQYDRIEKGMSPAQVVAILDASGMLLSSSQFDGASNEIYVWTNPDDSHVCLVFQDNRVLVKTQFGLEQAIR